MPSAGDLFLDLEGDPFWQYLVLWQEGEEIEYRAFWAHDPDAERRAFEAVTDFIHGRLVQDPQLHIYHYAGYERSTFKRLR